MSIRNEREISYTLSTLVATKSVPEDKDAMLVRLAAGAFFVGESQQVKGRMNLAIWDSTYGLGLGWLAVYASNKDLHSLYVPSLTTRLNYRAFNFFGDLPSHAPKGTEATY
jgi:hypothetical protein